jgi:hypothetical protein
MEGKTPDAGGLSDVRLEGSAALEGRLHFQSTQDVVDASDSRLKPHVDVDDVSGNRHEGAATIRH